MTQIQAKLLDTIGYLLFVNDVDEDDPIYEKIENHILNFYDCALMDAFEENDIFLIPGIDSLLPIKIKGE